MDLSGNYITTDADRWYLESFFFPSKNLIDFLKDWVNTLDYRVKTENIRQNRCLYLLFDTFWLPLTENSVIIKKKNEPFSQDMHLKIMLEAGGLKLSTLIQVKKSQLFISL
jgi:hypothetical protein